MIKLRIERVVLIASRILNLNLMLERRPYISTFSGAAHADRCQNLNDVDRSIIDLSKQSEDPLVRGGTVRKVSLGLLHYTLLSLMKIC